MFQKKNAQGRNKNVEQHLDIIVFFFFFVRGLPTECSGQLSRTSTNHH